MTTFLFTTLPTNDLGLLTRSLPIARELAEQGRRIAALGAGAMVPVEHDRGKKQVRVEVLRAAIRRVLTDPSFADNAARAGERMRVYGGAAQAARLIERFSQSAGGG